MKNQKIIDAIKTVQFAEDATCAAREAFREAAKECRYYYGGAPIHKVPCQHSANKCIGKGWNCWPGHCPLVY